MSKDNKYIPSGYKPSPLGPIPEGWEVKRLGEIANKIGDGIHGTPLYTDKSDYYFINGNNLNDGKIVITEATKCVPYSEYLKYKKELTKNTILISINGSIGNIALYNEEKVMLGKSAAYITIPNYKFFYHFLQSTQVKSIFEKELTGSTIRNLSLDSIRNLKVALPSQVEIDNITKIIDLWDTAIAKQTALIEKLTLRKRGLMQQLLTGKKRLKGFYEQWKTIELGDALSYIQPTKYLVVNENYHNTYNTPVLTAGKTFILGYTDETTGVFNDLPAIIFDDFTTESKYVTFPFKAKSSAMKILKAHNSNLYFMFCAMQMIKYSIGGHERHWISKFSHLTLKVPSLEEQNAIASVLVQSDKEIEIQKQKLAAMQEQKKGLMQVLLTGKKRIKTTSL